MIVNTALHDIIVTVIFILAYATVYGFKCFIQYWPDDMPLGPKHVAVKNYQNEVFIYGF